jgi:deoxycytidine triphosphate deaminase
MKKEKGADILGFLYNVIHEKKQVEDYGVYFTLGKVFKFTGKGEIDFGDSEYKESGILEITPVKRTPEDKYGWWNLPHGEYLIEFNEELQELLPSAKLVILQPSERITANGAFHPTKVIEKKGAIRVTLYVGKNGINIKKNARVSKLIVLK